MTTDEKKAAEKMARDHRTLQSNMFKLFMAWQKTLKPVGLMNKMNMRAIHNASEKMLNYLDSIN